MFGLSKPQSKDKGAKLAQVQNQAPDTIPGMFKPGEFVLPPDTVHAMGGKQALQGVVDATHTPVTPAGAHAPGLGLKVPQQQPEVFFANGGAPEDQVQQPGLGLKPSAAPSPGNTFPGNRLQGNSGFSGAPVAAPAPAPAAPKPVQAGMTDSQRADALAQIPTDGPKAPTADGSQDSWGNTEVGRNLGNAVAALPGLGGVGRVASTGGAISKGINAVSTAANNVGRVANSMPVISAGLYGASAPAAAATAPASSPAPAPAAAAAAAAAAATSPGAGQGRGLINPPLVKPAAVDSSIAQAPAATGNQVLDGVYNHGRGQYSDSAAGMGLPAGFTGKPNAQNDAAAGALAQSEAGGFGLKRPAQPEAVGFGLNAPTVTHSGNDWAARNNLRNLEVSASSITNRPEWRSGSTTTGWNGRSSNPGQADPDGKIGRFNAAMQADLAAQGKAPDLQQRTNEVNAGLQRAAMGEAGADRRAALAESGANARAAGQVGLGLQRLSIDQQRAKSDDRLRAPQIKAAERLGQLQDAYVSAKTPEEQAAIATQIRAYSGKEDADWKVQVTPATKNVDGSTTAGSVIRYNSRTGDVQDVGGVGKPQVPAKDSLKAGQVYQTPRGQARWNGSEFELVG